MENMEVIEQEIEGIFFLLHNEVLERQAKYKSAVKYFKNFFTEKGKESKQLKREIKEAFRTKGGSGEGPCLMYDLWRLRNRITQHHYWYDVLRGKVENEESGFEALPESYQKVVREYVSQNVRSGQK